MFLTKRFNIHEKLLQKISVNIADSLHRRGAEVNESNGTCSVQLKDQSLAKCTIDDRSLALYIINASDCTNGITCIIFSLF